jgi:hypothetical protein
MIISNSIRPDRRARQMDRNVKKLVERENVTLRKTCGPGMGGVITGTSFRDVIK